MFGMGTGEIILIALVVLVLFGANKLPQLGDGLGKALRGFKKAMSSVDEIKDQTKAALEPSEPQSTAVEKGEPGKMP